MATLAGFHIFRVSVENIIVSVHGCTVFPRYCPEEFHLSPKDLKQVIFEVWACGLVGMWSSLTKVLGLEECKTG
nr:hypothetical protein Itr_chr10CG07320 [Ipomoea trifida]